MHLRLVSFSKPNARYQPRAKAVGCMPWFGAMAYSVRRSLIILGMRVRVRLVLPEGISDPEHNAGWPAACRIEGVSHPARR
jgi:hypothetical protein